MIPALLAFGVIGWTSVIAIAVQFRRSQRALADSERLVASVKVSHAEYRAHVDAQKDLHKDLVRRVVLPTAKSVILVRPLPPDFALSRRVN